MSILKLFSYHHTSAIIAIWMHVIKIFLKTMDTYLFIYFSNIDYRL
jgi:hypothetical protein